MFDKFGMKIRIGSIGEGRFRTTVKVCASPDFDRWIFGSVGKIKKILDPSLRGASRIWIVTKEVNVTC